MRELTGRAAGAGLVAGRVRAEARRDGDGDGIVRDRRVGRIAAKVSAGHARTGAAGLQKPSLSANEKRPVKVDGCVQKLSNREWRSSQPGSAGRRGLAPVRARTDGVSCTENESRLCVGRVLGSGECMQPATRPGPRATPQFTELRHYQGNIVHCTPSAICDQSTEVGRTGSRNT